MKSIVIVSSGQPASNPRLVKEASYFSGIGYSVTVIYCNLFDWAIEFDKAIINEHENINWISIQPVTALEGIARIYYRFRRKCWMVIYRTLGDFSNSAIKSSVLYSQNLRKLAMRNKADIYIGHNLGSLWAVVDAAISNKGECYFDFEDYHRGEHSLNSVFWNRSKIIEDKFVGRLTGAWAASDLIAHEYKKIYSKIKIGVVKNCFPKRLAPVNLNYNSTGELKLFWFSQTIGKNRGLEQLLVAMGLLNNEKIRLTLLGNITSENKKYFDNIIYENGLDKKRIIFLKPRSEKDIVIEASNHDIGIASEVPHVLNRDLCITNKIFIYLLAGNAILYSNTAAQVGFLGNFNEVGYCYRIDNVEDLVSFFNKCFNEDYFLKNMRKNAYKLAQENLNWETESKKLWWCINN